MKVLGIDIGGSGIKGAPVDLATGELAGPRHRIPTPDPSEPEAVAEVVGQLARHFEWRGAIGCTFPAIVHHRTVLTAANVDDSWIGVDAVTLFERTTGCPVRVSNAHTAGLARWLPTQATARRRRHMLTLRHGHQHRHLSKATCPTELNTCLAGRTRRTAAAAPSKNKNFRKWAKSIGGVPYLLVFFSPDLFIIGGGEPKLQVPCPSSTRRIVPAQLALFEARHHRRPCPP